MTPAAPPGTGADRSRAAASSAPPHEALAARAPRCRKRLRRFSPPNSRSLPLLRLRGADSLPSEVIDEIANRVIARIGDESMRTAVLDAAERLVREEIARIKSQA